MNNKVAANLLLVLLGLSFAYYAVWVLLTVRRARHVARRRLTAARARTAQPFMDEQEYLASFFPDRYWALVVPMVAMVTLIAVNGAFIGLVLLVEPPPPSAQHAGENDNNDESKKQL